MLTYTGFKSASSNTAFWNNPIENINYGIATKHDLDAIGQPGVTLVIGCPLPSYVQHKVIRVQRLFTSLLAASGSSATVKWRDDLTALHVTIYGITKPKDYSPTGSWPLPAGILNPVQTTVSSNVPFDISLQGLGILGNGAIAVCVSDSPEIDRIRDDIEKIAGVSSRSFGEKANQIIIGRLLPDLTDRDRRLIKQALDDVEQFMLGTLTVNYIDLLHYKHEFLNRLFDRVLLP
ncbi:MAG: hypothetical protein WBE26_11155 [Phycisphaerae bacterium]